MSMPETVFLPRSQDFCRGIYDNHRGQCCFEGWKQTLFPDLTVQESLHFRAVAADEAKEMQLNGGGSYIGVTTTNDDKKNTKTQLAKWFERTVKKLGYNIS